MKVNINLSKIILVGNEHIPVKFELTFEQDSIKLEQLISELNKLYPPINFNLTLVIINGKIINDNETLVYNEDEVHFFSPSMGG